MERLLVEGLLRKNPDYRVELAENGKEALTKIAASPPDLVVTDLIMPEMDGLELVRTVRRRHPDIPVILMTAYGDETTVVDALEAGAASYVEPVQELLRVFGPWADGVVPLGADVVAGELDRFEFGLRDF